MTRSDAVATIATAIAVIGIAACGHSGSSGSNSADTANTPAASAAPTPSAVQTADTAQLTDAEILAEEEDGDSAEVAIATFVRAHSTSAPVKAYAITLINDHGRSLRETHSLADSLAITPQAPPSDTTAQETAHVLDRFRSLTGSVLDTAFVNHEITDHKHDISEAHKMSAAAQQPKVKSLIESSLPVLQKHLTRAEQLAK